MRIALILASLICHVGLYACVTYNPSTGTYTVDPSGNSEEVDFSEQPRPPRKLIDYED